MQETLEACKKSLNIHLLLLSASWSSWWPLVVGEYGANIMHKPVQFADDRSIVGMESKGECERSHGRNLAFVSTSLLYVERWPTIFPHYVMTRMFNFVFFLFFFHGILNNFLDAIALVKRVTITCMHLVLVAEFNGTKHIKYWPYFQIKKQQPMALTSDLDVNCTTA